MNCKIKSSTFTGNGAAQNISLGFTPSLVGIMNVTDGDAIFWHITGMTGSIDIEGTLGPVTDSGGITAYAGSETASKGFSIDAGNSENAKVYRYIALGEE